MGSLSDARHDTFELRIVAFDYLAKVSIVVAQYFCNLLLLFIGLHAPIFQVKSKVLLIKRHGAVYHLVL
jgi:hypothetical protein